MIFLVIMLNVFALAGFTVLWLSLSLIAVDIYKSGKNVSSAISLARISTILKLLILLWFALLGIAFMAADNILPLVLYLVFFVGLYFYIQRLYASILKAVSSIRKDDSSAQSKALIRNTLVVADNSRKSFKKQGDFIKFKKFFWGLNGLICAGAVINFWLMDVSDSSFWEIVVASIMMVTMLQVLFVPILFIVKKIVFATLAHN